MLIEFTVGNYRSFNNKITLSMEAAKISSKDRTVDENNLITIKSNLSLLTSAAIYGANASGKSNLVHAMSSMRELVLNSARESQAEEPIKIEPFRLSTTTLTEPAYFQVIFLIDNERYRYGFEVTNQKVTKEWLFCTPTIREAQLFFRQQGTIETNPRKFREGSQLEKRTRENALFLSVSAQFNGPVSQKIVKWFRNLRFISGLNDMGYRGYTLKKYLKEPDQRENINNLVRNFDTGVEGISVIQVDPNEVTLPKGMPEQLKKLFLETPGDVFVTQTQHTLFDGTDQPIGQVTFDLDENESEGTKKLFYLSGPLLDVLSHGRILVVDEMEARMHPLITQAISCMFNSLETNPNRAQLIFTTHDTNLLDKKLFRRDQIWFTEKDSYGATHLYSLVEFKPRNDESLERNYLHGKYGALPYLGNLSQITFDEEQPVAEVSENVA